MKELKIKKVRENAKLPTRATEGSAGYDLYACIDKPLTLKAGETAINTTINNLSAAMPTDIQGSGNKIYLVHNGTKLTPQTLSACKQYL